MLWRVDTLANEIAANVQLDFRLDAEVSPPPLAPSDTFYLVFGNNSRGGGKVITAESDRAVIEIDSGRARWNLKRAAGNVIPFVAWSTVWVVESPAP